MSRINTNVSSIIGQRVLGQNNQTLGVALERLSTGLKINRGKDDPAGLIASENLRSEKAALTAAIGNAERADQVVNIAEGGLQEVSSLLTELQGLLTTSANTAGLSESEKQANQLQIDSILQTIDRVAGATNFQGSKLLNGNMDYQVNGVAGSVTDFQVRGAKFDGASQAVNAIITQSAQQAGLFMSFGAGNIDLTAGEQFVIEVGGVEGNRELQFASGTSLNDIAAAINAVNNVTGVTATVDGGGTAIKLTSDDFGSSEFVSLKVTNDGGISAGSGILTLSSTDFGTATPGSAVAFNSSVASNGIRDLGQDIGGTINGLLAVGKGKQMSVNSDFLDVAFTLNTTAAQTLDSVSAFTITGGGADFQLSSQVNVGGKVSIGIGDISTRKLGNSELGFLNDLASGRKFNVVNGENFSDAQKIVAQAIEDVSSTRGRLGAFQKNVVGATIRSLNVAFENTTAAESVIRDADFASETASLTRNQILVQASTNVLALANQSPQNVLALLG
ncbi:MAG: flagellin [Phycisphaerales bacterium]|nr:flagellin [Planctomycetota bacterium]MCH8509017.1 flagellin [Phycisphaerales bacterium]